MVKLTSYLTLVLLGFALGCSPGIVDNPPPTTGDAEEYFWPAGITSAVYERFDAGTSKKTRFELFFVGDSGYRHTKVSDRSANATAAFSYSINNNGIYLENLTGSNSFIPIPEGFTLMKDTAITVSRPREIERVLVTGASSMLAVDKDDDLYYTTDGSTWGRSSWSDDKITAWVVSGEGIATSIYAATEKGDVYRSTSLGKSWELLVDHDREITALAISDTLNTVYFTDGDNVYEQYLSKGSPISLVSQRELDAEVTSLAIIGEQQKPEQYLIAGAEKGIYRIKIFTQKAMKWDTISTLKCRSLVTMNPKAMYALSESNGNVSLITSTDAGLTWTIVDGLDDAPSLLAAGSSMLFTASENGVLQVFTPPHTVKSDHVVAKVNDISARYGIYAAATDTGIVMYKQGYNWDNVTRVPILSDETIRVEQIPGGSLLIMKNDEHSLDSGYSWSAGKCKGRLSGNTVEFIIGAKVHAALSSLSLKSDGGSDYDDVIPISYSFLLADNPQVTAETAKLVIYFARNKGPVLIAQYIGKILILRIYRIED